MQGAVQAQGHQTHIDNGAGAMSVFFIQRKLTPGLDCFHKVCHLGSRVGKLGQLSFHIRNIRLESYIQVTFRAGNVRSLFGSFPIQNNLTAVFVGIGYFSPSPDSIWVLLGCVHFHLHGAGMVLAQKVLDRIEVMLAHVTQTSAVVIPITTEGAMYPMSVVRSVWSGPQPTVIIQFCGDWLWLKIRTAHPEEFPVKAG